MSSSSNYTHPDRPSNTPRPLKIIHVGAGPSGINLAKQIKTHFPRDNITLTIYEKNSDVGGTWFENRYPGCACDIPAHSYQLTFEPNKTWSKFYAPAREIEAYWQGVAKKYDIYKHIKLEHRVVEAKWDDDDGKWKVV